ncbi:glycosyltransferase [bacterium]|nr:glycosyltransferase [bacterium]
MLQYLGGWMTENISNGWMPINEWGTSYLDEHMEILKMFDPSAYEALLSCKPSLDRVEITLQQGFPYQVRSPGKAEKAIQPPEALRQSIQHKLNHIRRHQPAMFFLAGSGLGYELTRVQDLTQDLPETVVMVMEEDPTWVWISLILTDLRPLLSRGAIVWVVGNPLEQNLLQVVNEHGLFQIFEPQMDIVVSSTASEPAVRQRYAAAYQNAWKTIVSWRKAFEDTESQFLKSFNQETAKPAHVWSSGSRTEYASTPIVKAIHHGLALNGLKTTFTALPKGRTHKLVEYRGIVEADPDTVFTLNDPTRSYVPNGVFHRMVWVTDDPFLRKNYRTAPKYDPTELVFYADRSYQNELKRQGAERMALLPEFALLEREGQYREEYAFPLVFVGMVWSMEPFLSSLKTADRDVLEEAHAGAVESGEGTSVLREWWMNREVPDTLLNAAKAFYGQRGRTHAAIPETLSYIVYMMNMYYRRWFTAKALLPLGLHVFGNKEWLPLLGDGYQDRYHGLVEYGRLADIYQSATIAVNLHSLQLPTALNIRDYDILMAGGCLLADPVEEMSEETLLPGRDCETAATPSGFHDMAEALLGDPGRCDRLARQGRETVLQNHLPGRRAERMLNAYHKHLSA